MPESASAAKRSIMLPMAPMPFWHIVKVVCSSVSIAALGEQLGVRCLDQGSHLSRGHFLPEPGFEPTTLGYLGFQVQCSIH